MKGRLAVLEDRVEYLELRGDSSPEKGMEGLFERYRREAVYHLKRRVLRDVPTDGRRIRDIPECVCPAGKISKMIKYLLTYPQNILQHFNDRVYFFFFMQIREHLLKIIKFNIY